MDGRNLVYTGAGDALRKTLSREGVTGLYKGLGPHAVRSRGRRARGDALGLAAHLARAHAHPLAHLPLPSLSRRSCA